MTAHKTLQPSARTAHKPGDGQYLTFNLAREAFAISINCIKEIIEYGQLTPVPMVPDFVRGVINLRGQVVPVIDLQARLKRPASAVSKRTCIIIFDLEAGAGERESVGAVVDSVSEVLSIQADQIERPPQFGANLRPDFIAGMGKIGGNFVPILNMDTLIAVDEMSALVNRCAG